MRALERFVRKEAEYLNLPAGTEAEVMSNYDRRHCDAALHVAHLLTNVLPESGLGSLAVALAISKAQQNARLTKLND